MYAYMLYVYVCMHVYMHAYMSTLVDYRILLH